MSTSDEVSRLLARTRANRDRINKHLTDIGESPHPIRSPLKERNAAVASASPSKIRTTYSSKSPSKPESGFRSRSPSGIRTTTTTTTVTKSGSPAPSIEMATEENMDGIEKKKETFDRELKETKTTIEDSPVRRGNMESYKKTTITEKEEKIHKTQYVKFTEVPNTPGGKERLKSLAVKFSGEDEIKEISMRNDYDDDEEEEEDEDQEEEEEEGSPPPPPLPRSSPPKAARFPMMDSSSSAARRRRAPSPPKSVERTPIITSSLREVDTGYDEETFGASGRKKRLAALAAKFNKYDYEDVTEAPNNLDVTREIDVDEELAAIEDAAEEERRNREKVVVVSRNQSPSKIGGRTQDLAKDDNFIRSLKAQGFEESNSKTKLVYDFKRTPQGKQVADQGGESTSKRVHLSSPTRNATEPRAISPFKPHPMQFISPQVMALASPTRSQSPTKASSRPVSPYKPVTNPMQLVSSPSRASNSRPASPSKANGRPISPYKPVTNPMQFISSPAKARPQSPTKARPVSPYKAADLDNSVSRPPKPARTWAAVDETSAAEEEQARPNMWRTEARMNVTPRQPRPQPPPKPATTPMTDTASRRSISQKMSLFEGQQEDETVEGVDPAMLSMSQRRALFEKHKTAPKPVARFGDAVTPAMLNRGQGVIKSTRAAPPPPMARPNSPLKQQSAATEHRSRSPFKYQPVNRPSPKRMASPIKELLSSPKRIAATNIQEFRTSPAKVNPRSPSPPPPPPPPPTEPHYPGVNSLKRIRVSPPKPGQMYPQLMESSDDNETRPNTAMSEESVAASEAPSLGSAIKRAASGHLNSQAMPAIFEDVSTEDSSSHTGSCEIDDILDEAMDDSGSIVLTADEGPTPPKNARKNALSPTASAASWEFETPQNQMSRKRHRDFRTPLVDGGESSPQGELPQIEGEEGQRLLHTVSFYRKQKPNVQVTPLAKIIRNNPCAMPALPEEDNRGREAIQIEIRKLQDETEEQRQRMEQTSKALNFCVSQDEFLGSGERVEGERLLLESTHKYSAATAEIRRLSTEGAIGKSTPQKNKPVSCSRGAISISGMSLPLRADFIRMLRDGGDDTVHYFVVLVKYRARVIATQMLSTIDGVTAAGKLVLPNLINLRDLDFDFQIHIEVYGLQTRKENIAHDVKYHIRKEKSMFNLTPMKKMKKQETRILRNQNPVNTKTIRRPAFGLVGYSIINIETLKNRAFHLDKVPECSPLAGGLEMTLTIHSENRVNQSGFLTMFTDVNGYGDWCRRWCRLAGNQISLWKYPEDEGKSEPTHLIDLSACVTDEVTLAPRDICSRMNTIMLQTRRPTRQSDKKSLTMEPDRRDGFTTVRHLLSADTRDDRIGWSGVLNKAVESIRAWDPTAFRPRAGSQSSTTTVDSATPSEGAASTSTAASTDIW